MSFVLVSLAATKNSILIHLTQPHLHHCSKLIFSQAWELVLFTYRLSVSIYFWNDASFCLSEIADHSTRCSFEMVSLLATSGNIEKVIFTKSRNYKIHGIIVI